jgi:hypothetical protein
VTGGGTWGAAPGSVSGTYKVTRLASWVREPLGALPPTLIDKIGNKADATAGLAVFNITYSDGDTGVLTVSCDLPGAPAAIFEGITVSKGPVDFWNHVPATVGPNSNRTVFHILRPN